MLFRSATIFFACNAAEKAANEAALKSIGDALKGWSPPREPTVVERVFVWTFGDARRSRKRRVSAAVVTLIYVALVLVTITHFSDFDASSYFYTPGVAGRVLIDLCLIGGNALAFGYFPLLGALNKSRWILGLEWWRGRPFAALALVPFDLILSSLLVAMASFGYGLGYGFAAGFFAGFHDLPTPVIDENVIAWGKLFCLLPIMTSLWTILLFSSTLILNIASPLWGFTVWFFDIGKHPVQAIGIVGATLIIFAGLLLKIAQMVF